MTATVERRTRPIRAIRLPTTAELRTWAIEKGYTTSTHGRLPTWMVDAWVGEQMRERGLV